MTNNQEVIDLMNKVTALEAESKANFESAEKWKAEALRQQELADEHEKQFLAEHQAAVDQFSIADHLRDKLHESEEENGKLKAHCEALVESDKEGWRGREKLEAELVAEQKELCAEQAEALKQHTRAEDAIEVLRAIAGALRSSVYYWDIVTRPKDWACAQCAPTSEILAKDFRCAYHEAIHVLTENEAWLKEHGL